MFNLTYPDFCMTVTNPTQGVRWPGPSLAANTLQFAGDPASITNVLEMPDSFPQNLKFAGQVQNPSSPRCYAAIVAFSSRSCLFRTSWRMRRLQP